MVCPLLTHHPYRVYISESLTVLTETNPLEFPACFFISSSCTSCSSAVQINADGIPWMRPLQEKNIYIHFSMNNTLTRSCRMTSVCVIVCVCQGRLMKASVFFLSCFSSQTVYPIIPSLFKNCPLNDYCFRIKCRN